MKSSRTWWFLFSVGAAVVLAALAWITALVLRMEATAQHEASVRLALYRMDFWLSPRIGRERLRPYFEYLPFYAQQRAYTRILHAIEPGEVITPSPLLTFESEIFLLHFQVGADGELTSPQAPTGNWRDLAEGAYLEPGALDRRQVLLERVRTLLPVQPRLESCVAGAESLIADLIGGEPAVPALPAPAQIAVMDPPPPSGPSPQQTQQWASGMQQRAAVQSQISKADVSRRAIGNYMPPQQQESQAPQMLSNEVVLQPQKGGAFIEVESVQVDELVPVWLEPDESPSQSSDAELVLLRRVRIGDDVMYQGILCDWPALRNALLEQINDLFPTATIVPLPHPSTSLLETGRLLGSVPAALEPPPPRIVWNGALTPARTTLMLAWLGVIGAIIAAGFALQSSIAFGEKRSRFASAVTHELRTPLTTFRMYSEMLADNMVRDEAQRQTYLRTLQQESGRLSTLVENVLSYARLEEGRIARHVQSMTAAGLLERVRGVLGRRAEEAGMQVVMTDRTAADCVALPINIDAEIVEQILFNLVDNACKYASGSADARIEIDFKRDKDGLTIRVRDHGPGISPEHRGAIFKAFDRGAHGPGDTIPGVGLGLALSQGLARDLGGELALARTNEPGACFILTLRAG